MFGIQSLDLQKIIY